MAKQVMAIVNASSILSDDEVCNVIPALQIQFDRDFKPAWRDMVPDIEYRFAGVHDIANLDPSWWPLFLNRHSKEPGALGWHTEEGKKIFGRVFVADCIRFGLDWSTTLGHEAHETALDPNAQRVWRMHDGSFAALEVADAVESDDQSIDITTPAGHRVKCTNWVTPYYFSDRVGPGVKYDFGGHLKGPCPQLTEGGYMSIFVPGHGWTTKQEDRADGLPGRRFLMSTQRRSMYQRLTEDQFHVVDPTVGWTA